MTAELYLKLQPDYVDPVTQTPLPDGVLVIGDYQLLLAAALTALRVGTYASLDTYLSPPAGPLSDVTTELNSAELAQYRGQVLQVLYTILAARPEFAGSQVISGVGPTGNFHRELPAQAR